MQIRTVLKGLELTRLQPLLLVRKNHLRICCKKVQGSDDYLEPFLNLQTKGSEGGCAGTVEGYIKNAAAV